MKQITRAAIVATDGYWWFHYDMNDKYETHSIYTMYLNDLTFEEWVKEGVDFVKRMQNL